MSGEAGAQLRSEYYSIFIGRGVMVSVARPPWEDGSYVARYFEEASAPYHRWLERARPALDALFSEWVAAGDPALPIVRLDQPFEQVDGAVIETPDRKSEHFRQYHRGGPLMVHAHSHGQLLPDHQSLNLALLVSTRVRQEALDELLKRVAAVLVPLEHEPEPPTPPAPSPPSRPPASGFWRRLAGWLRSRSHGTGIM
jgi:hypothetical protein